MPTVKARIMPHDPDEEHLMRRLAKSIAVLWDSLPEISQAIILAQAGMMHDDEETTQLKEQLEAFVEKHRKEGHS